MNNGEDEAGRRQLLHLLRLLYPIQHVHYQWRQLWIAKRLGLQLEASIQTLHPSTWNTYSISVNRIVSLKMEHYKNTFRWTKYICPKGGKYKSRSQCLKIQPKSLIRHCERSELCLHFEWTKLNFKCQKKSILAIFWKLETCGQTVLPDRLVVIERKLWGFQIFRVIFNPMQLLVIWKLHLYICII